MDGGETVGGRSCTAQKSENTIVGAGVQVVVRMLGAGEQAVVGMGVVWDEVWDAGRGVWDARWQKSRVLCEAGGTCNIVNLWITFIGTESR